MREEFADAAWHKANGSSDGNCVEVAVIPTKVGVRDTKNRNGAMLEFSLDSWQSFVDGVRAGEFDQE